MSNITFNEGTYKFRGEHVSVAGMTFPLVTSFKKANKNGGRQGEVLNYSEV